MKIRTRIAATVFAVAALASLGAGTASAALVGDAQQVPLCTTSVKQCGWALGGSR